MSLKTDVERASALFPLDEWEKHRAFLETRPEYNKFLDYRKDASGHQGIGNLFFGDSLTNWWPLQEFFPGVSILNRGVTGDTALGLHFRIDADVLAYAPKRVFVMVGTNDIEEDRDVVFERILRVLSEIKNTGAEVCASSIPPLRNPDEMDVTDEDWEKKMGFSAQVPGRDMVIGMVKETTKRRLRHLDKLLWINEGLQGWARENGAAYVDYFTALADDSGQLAEACAMPDGNHLTYEAYRRMSKVVEPLLVR